MQHVHGRRTAIPARPGTTCRSWAWSGPGAAAAALATRNRRVGVIATPATVRSHAYFNAIKDENPAVEVYEHATPRFVPMVEAGILSGPELEAVMEEELAPLLGERDGAGEFVFPRPPASLIDTLLLGCTHYPLLRGLTRLADGGPGRDRGLRHGDRGDPGELLSVNGLEAPGTTRGTAADPGGAGHSRPTEAYGAPASHVQLTTGDVERFRSIASRMFGESFPDVEASSSGRYRERRLMPADEFRVRTAGTGADPEERLWQVGFVVGSVHGRRGDGRRPTAGAFRARRGPRRLAAGRGHRDRAAAAAPGP